MYGMDIVTLGLGYWVPVASLVFADDVSFETGNEAAALGFL